MRDRFAHVARAAVLLWAAAILVVVLAGVGVFLITLGLGMNVRETWEAWVSAGFMTLTLVFVLADLLPRRSPDVPGEQLAGDRLAEVGEWVHTQTGARYTSIRVVADPEVWVAPGDRLRIGIGLVACLQEEELATLVRLARDIDGSLSRTERLALRLAHGGVGGAMFRPDGRVLRPLRRRLAETELAWHRWVVATESTASVTTSPAAAGLSARDVVTQGWEQLVRPELESALLVGAWHEDPWTGLRTMLGAWEQEGADVWPHRSEPSRTSAAADALPAAMQCESSLARLILPAALPRDEEPTAWEDRPERVDEPLLRRQVAVVLDAVRVATGRAVPATVTSLVTALQGGWGTTVEAILGAASGEESDDGTRRDRAEPGPGDSVTELVAQAVAEIISLALLDASVGRLRWAWAGGTELVDPAGRPIDVPGAIHRLRRDGPIDLIRLSAWLREHGADPSAPVWLAQGVQPDPEVPVMVFAAARGLRPERVLLTTRALRFCKTTLRGPVWEPAGPDTDPGATALDAATRNDLGEIVPCFPLADIVRVDAAPNVGGVGSWWLTVYTADRRRRVWTNENRRTLLPELGAVLGDRLSLTWWSMPAPLRWARNTWGMILGGGGGALVVVGLLMIADPPADASPGLADQLWIIGIGLAGVAFALLPDWLLKRLRPRPERGLLDPTALYDGSRNAGT